MSDRENNFHQFEQKNIVKKPNARRRSSFFQRRQSNFSSDCSTFGLTEVELYKNNSNEEVPHLSLIISKLKKEKEDWKKTTSNLKKENNELKANYSNILDQSASRELLTEEDRTFLQARPDYVRLARLLDRSAESIALRRRRASLTYLRLNQLTLDCNQSLSDLTKAFIIRTMNGFDEFVHDNCDNKILDCLEE